MGLSSLEKQTGGSLEDDWLDYDSFNWSQTSAMAQADLDLENTSQNIDPYLKMSYGCGHQDHLSYDRSAPSQQRSRKMLEDSLYWLMSPVSETDLHDMLAEVIAGDRHDLITGIRGDIWTYTWQEQPRLWHYLQSEDGSDDATAKEGSNASLKVQLASSVADPDACLDLLLGGFTSALCGMLHMKPEELDTNVPVASIGIDSLVAVRVREWFMQQDVLAIWRKQVKA
ncbi:polyketide synthase [Fusarium globosum]|uniref:Polyketide synthase n=1 Tax=Fusarium globosum TaxID=78864 RepID=A0A8H6DCZ8_9HYPO|nr:polyketide synthase [Fusarium globosum]